MDALDRHGDRTRDWGSQLLAELLDVPLLAADEQKSLRQTPEALGHGENPIGVGQVDVRHVRGFANVGLDEEESARRRPAVDRIDDDQAFATCHQLLHQRHATNAALEHFYTRGHGFELCRDCIPEAVVAAQDVANAGDEYSPCIVQAKEGIWMSGFDQLLDDMERLLAELEESDDAMRERVFSLLDGVDAVHRHALGRLEPLLGPEQVERLRNADPAVAWLFEAYAVGVDERAAAEAALESVRPYLHSHGGDVAVLDSRAGVVTVRLSGACSGCTASTITLRRGVEEALREGFRGFAAMQVEEAEDALPHPPPGPTLLQIAAYPSAAGDAPGAG